MIPFKTRIKSGVVQRLEVIESLSFQGQELTPGAATDEKTKVSSNDTTAGYLNGKLVAGSGIVLTENNNGGNETLTISANAVDLDVKVSVSANDTTAGYLNGKLVAGTGITFTENNNGGDETLTVTLGSHTHAASDITSGLIATARLGTGTANSTTVLYGDQTYKTPPTGVTGFTGSQNTAAPNNTVNASRLLVDAASTNADAVLQPKGTGAVLARLPDGSLTGGDKRGVNAVDLQTSANNRSQVASGAQSVIAGGATNTASGNVATVGGGQSNVASGNASAVSGGATNTASGLYSAIPGGFNNTASGESSLACGAFALADRYGQFSNASGRFAATGDAQYERYVLRRQTTTNAVTELSTDGAAPQISTRILCNIGHCLAFNALVAARRTDVFGEAAGYEIKGVIYNNGGTTQFIGTPTVTVLGETTAAWDVSVSATALNSYLVFNVTGENSKTIRWVATVHVTRVG